MKKLIALLILLLLLTSCALPATVLEKAAYTPDNLEEHSYPAVKEDSAASALTEKTTEAANTPVPAVTEPAPTPSATAESTEHKYSGKLRSHYLDVGQGDSEFIELPNGKCMLIDAGEREYGSTVVSYIKNLGYKKIDYIVVTHAHSDHMGGMSEVIKSFSVGKIYMPKAGNNTPTYEKLLQTIADKGLTIKTAKAGVKIINKEDLKAEIISPTKDYEELNNTSAVVMITFGKTKFLYMGDAEREAENNITADVKCNVVKVGHHGSTTSSSYEFIARTHAKHAVISVGEGNDYGHPKAQTLERWTKSGARIWRTDLNGTVTATSNGNRVTFKAERKTAEPTPAPVTVLVINTNTKKIHRKDCEHVKEIQQWNYKETTENVYDLIEQGYIPCNACNPEQ